MYLHWRLMLLLRSLWFLIRSFSVSNRIFASNFIDKSYKKKEIMKYLDFYENFYLTRYEIILGENVKTNHYWEGPIWPEELFGVFIIKIKRKTNFMPILRFILCLNEYLIITGGGYLTWAWFPNLCKNIVYNYTLLNMKPWKNY